MGRGISPGTNPPTSDSGNALVRWADKKQNEIKELQKQIKKLKSQQINISELLNQARPFTLKGGVSGQLLLADLDLDDRQVLRDISDQLRDQIDSGVIFVVGKGEETHPVIVNVSSNLLPSVHAGKLLKEFVTPMGGKGGGRPDSAQGAASDRSQLNQAFKVIEKQFPKNKS